MPRIVLFASIIALSFSCLGLTGCNNVKNSAPDPVSPIYVEFSFPQGLPSINEAKELECLVKTADRDTENVEITINLPDGLQLVSGNLSAKYAAMSKNDVKELLATIEPVRYDDYTIEVKFSCGSKYTYSGMFNIYLSNIDLSNIDGPTWWDIFPINRKGLSERWLPAVKLSLPYAPAVNQTADLTCTIFSDSDVEDAKVVIESSRRWLAPEESKKLTRSNLQGESIFRTLNLKTDGVVSFSSKIAFKETGYWSINANIRTGYGDTINLTVSTDKGEIGWTKDYRPSMLEWLPSDEFPIFSGVDIPTVPRLNEPVKLTWFVVSTRDIAQVSGKVQFKLMKGTDGVPVPLEKMLVQGDLTWNGDLKSATTVDLTAIIKFPEEGDWEISVAGCSPQAIGYAGSNPLFLHIGKDKGRWGWTEPHEIVPAVPPLPPPAVLPDGTWIPVE